MPQERHWGVAVQKIVGARQKWRCAKCDTLLPSSYEVDHVLPLWNGGPDCYETNAQALCPTCHATKTQLESIERRRKNDDARLEAVNKALAIAETTDSFMPIHGIRQVSRVRKPANVCVADDTFTSDNPFLQFAFVRDGKVRGYVR
tara:strand:- start:46 stop:483 length:438 start_codon:yes stop_codon:yes gene_type:complete